MNRYLDEPRTRLRRETKELRHDRFAGYVNTEFADAPRPGLA